MSRNVNNTKGSMPIGGNFTVKNNPTGKPASQGSIKYGEDLRGSKGGK
jgi:hypothetical protein